MTVIRRATGEGSDENYQKSNEVEEVCSMGDACDTSDQKSQKVERVVTLIR